MSVAKLSKRSAINFTGLPSFIDAAPPEIAIPLYEKFVTLLNERVPGRVRTGEFGAVMDVELVNQGPVTILLER